MSADRDLLLAALLEEEGIESTGGIPAMPGRRQAPLSFPQQRLWFLDQLTPGLSAYNIVNGGRLRGRLDVAALGRAVNGIVARHDSLRTTFQSRAGSPVQIVADPAPLTVPVIDMPGLDETARAAASRDAISADAAQPFDLERGPLFRVRLLRFAADDHALVTSMHHIVGDGWSLGVFVQELAAMYEAFVAGRPSPLAALPIQYGDYAVWQAEQAASGDLARQLAHWKHTLSGTLPVLDLPTDRPRPAIQTYAGSHVRVMIPEPTAARIREFCQRERVTLFIFLLAAYNALLRRISGTDDLIIGSPVAGRRRPEVEPLIGFFVNTLLFRVSAGGDPSFSELVAHTREVALNAYENQEVPFEKLVEELQPERDMSRAPLFQTMLILQAPGKAPGFADLEISLLEPELTSTKFDLTLFLGEGDGFIWGQFEYNTDLFDRSTIERLAAQFTRVVDGVLDAPRAPLSKLSLLSEIEQTEIVRDWNATTRPIPAGTVTDAFAAQVASVPDATAVVCEGRAVSYRELDELSNRIARRLARLGVRRESKVGVCLERSVAMVAAALAVWKAGGAYIPLDPAFPQQRLAFMAEDAGLDALITESALRELMTSYGGAVLDLDEPLGESAEPLLRESGARDLAYVLYTSGSTGQPKGVMIEHEALVNFLASMRAEPGLSSADRLLAVTTLSFDIAGLELWLPLTTGACVVVAPREAVADPAALLKLIDQERITVMQATPATWRLLVESGWTGHPHLKILCGGEAMSPELADALLNRGASVWNLYGPTETTIWSMIEKVERGATRPVLVGRPIANTEVYVLDAHQRPAPVGVIGEIFIGGRGLARGYWKREALTAEKFVPHPFAPGERLYRTGDLGRFRAGGRLEFLGRADHQVKVRGYRIELGEIETLLRQVDGVNEAVVVARGETLAAYLEGSAAQIPDAAELRARLKEKLPAYMIPASFTVLERLPLTPNGKVDRRALPAPAAASVESARAAAASYVPPQSQWETTVAKVWAEFLGVERVGRDDNFFDLGGHSLLLARVHGRLKELAPGPLTMTDMFKYPTVSALGSYLARAAEPAVTNAPAQPALKGSLDRASLRLNRDKRRVQ